MDTMIEIDIRGDHPTVCPHCGRKNPLHRSIDGEPAVPKDGDMAICWACIGPSIFQWTPFGLTQRMPTEAETQEIKNDPRIPAMLAAMAQGMTPSGAVTVYKQLMEEGDRDE